MNTFIIESNIQKKKQQNFHYDGEGPDAYFWAGSSAKPDQSGFIIPDEKGSTKPLGAYRNKDVLLKVND